MKKIKALFLLFTLTNTVFAQVERSSNLYKAIIKNDSLLFNVGFNTCDIRQFENLLSEKFEFFHDKDSISYKTEFIHNLKNGLCISPTTYQSRRELVDGSTEIYPLYKNKTLYGAIQNGIHKFYETVGAKKENFASTAKFTHVWLLENKEWKLAKSLSYDHQTTNTLVNKSSVLNTEKELKYQVSYAQLKQYEGLYEYVNKTTLKIAASPIDTTLYAIINESRYKLSSEEKDLFLDATKNKIQFFRNKKNEITGYYKGNDTLKLLNNKLVFPKEMWYPRLNVSENYKYSYLQPENDNDGLKTGNLNNTGLDKTLLNEMMQKIISGTYPNVHSVLIIKDGKLVFEEYFYEHNKNKLHELRSATKSFISALTGIAIEKGYIKSKDEKVLPYFPEYTFKHNLAAKNKITIENLLTNQSGLDCDTYNPKAVGNESIMAYEKDWIQYSLDLPMIDSAGGIGQYCSSNPIIMGRIIEKATKMTLPEFATQTLFKGIGIKKYDWQFKPDPSSGETFCQLNLRPRDMAKFGLLYLNNGEWNGKQVISKEWVEQSLDKHSVVAGLDYGYLWWTKYLDADGVRYYGKLAQGNGGQKIYVFEEQNLVVVTTANHYNTQSPINEIVAKYILPAFNKK